MIFRPLTVASTPFGRAPGHKCRLFLSPFRLFPVAVSISILSRVASTSLIPHTITHMDRSLPPRVYTKGDGHPFPPQSALCTHSVCEDGSQDLKNTNNHSYRISCPPPPTHTHTHTQHLNRRVHAVGNTLPLLLWGACRRTFAMSARTRARTHKQTHKRHTHTFLFPSPTNTITAPEQARAPP